MNQGLITTELYMRYEDKGGHSHVMHHYVWDSALFVATRQKEARQNGGSAQPITREQYLSRN